MKGCPALSWFRNVIQQAVLSSTEDRESLPLLSNSTKVTQHFGEINLQLVNRRACETLAPTLGLLEPAPVCSPGAAG